MTSPQRIAWIGTGVMGAAMAGHLLSAGHRLIVHSRSKSKAQSLLDRGAEWADSPAAAAEGADIAISMVGYPHDVESVHLGQCGTLAASRPPRLIIDMTTSRPLLAAHIADFAHAKHVASLDAPVSGGDIGAKNASLSIMVGGDKSAFDDALPILSIMGKTIIHQGGPGAGQHTKMVNQILIASNMMGACEGVLYAMKAGLDPMRVIESVGSGAAGSWSINNLGPRMIRRDFNPGFYVEHFIKDLEIALEEAARMNLALPGLALARHLYEATRAQGHDRLGTQALLLTLEQRSNINHHGVE
jgi:3-hydroxyisobutyrate dehydrogenase